MLKTGTINNAVYKKIERNDKMFFIMGISNRQKKLNFVQWSVCKCCGSNSQIEVYMTYTCLSIFFIPIFGWNKRYFVRMSCCGAVCEIDSELGRSISHGKVTHIDTDSLDFTKFGGNSQYVKKCRNCGFTTSEDYGYCPKCGQRLH